MCTHTDKTDISSDPECNKCMVATVGILTKIQNKEISASMSGIEYYFECVDKASKIISDTLRYERLGV